MANNLVVHLFGQADEKPMDGVPSLARRLGTGRALLPRTHGDFLELRSPMRTWTISQIIAYLKENTQIQAHLT